MTGRHRDDDVSSPGKIRALLDYPLADVAVSIGCLVVVMPFGILAVLAVGVMLLLAWLV